MKKRLLAVIIILILIFLYTKIKYYIEDSKYLKRTISIITENQDSKDINYYLIEHIGKIKKIDKFNNQSQKITVNGCYDDYILKGIKLNLKKCVFINDKKEEIKINNDLKNIVTQVSKINHDIIGNKIFVMDNLYFVEVELNVNMWSPYELYYYDIKNNKLIKYYTFDNIDIVGIKIN